MLTVIASGQAVVPDCTSEYAKENFAVPFWATTTADGGLFAWGVRNVKLLPLEGTSNVDEVNTAPSLSWSVMTGHPFNVHEPALDLVSVTLA
jgi:hypothetical protein